MNDAGSEQAGSGFAGGDSTGGGSTGGGLAGGGSTDGGLVGGVRIGVDLLTISRFVKIADHARYRSLVFTGPELDEAGQPGTGRYAERLAGRFCVKEATCKLLGRGFGQGVRWRDIEVTSDAWGAPHVSLSGGAAEVAAAVGVAGISASITHQSDIVVAVVTATLQPGSQPGSGDGHDRTA